MRKGLRRAFILSAFVFTMSLSSCVFKGAQEGPERVDATELSLSPSSIDMKVGETKTFTLQVTPANAHVILGVTDENIIKIDKNKHTVTAVGEGKAAVVARSGMKFAAVGIVVTK